MIRKKISFSRLEHFLDKEKSQQSSATDINGTMTYTYVQLQRNQSFLHSYIQAMVILGDGSTFEFIHNFPRSGLVNIERILDEWTRTSTHLTAIGLMQFMRQWRNRRKWLVLKNKHFFDCFIVPIAALQANRIATGRKVGEEWWLQRF